MERELQYIRSTKPIISNKLNITQILNNVKKSVKNDFSANKLNRQEILIQKLTKYSKTNESSQIWKELKIISKNSIPYINELYTNTSKNGTTVNPNYILDIET